MSTRWRCAWLACALVACGGGGGNANDGGGNDASLESGGGGDASIDGATTDGGGSPDATDGATQGDAGGGSCGAYFDAIRASTAQCVPTMLALAAPLTGALAAGDRDAFLAACEALSQAPGSSNFDSQLDACTAIVQANTACTFAPACTIKGSLADGQPCANGAQCAGGNCLLANATTEPPCGTCGEFAQPNDPCPHGNECDPTTSGCIEGTCVAYATQGTACTVFDGPPCPPNLLCQSACEPYPGKGQPCGQQFFCAEPYRCINFTCSDAVQQNGSCTSSRECADGLVCSGSTCQPQSFVGLGQTCGSVNNALVGCQPGLRCDDVTTHECIALTAQGGTCTPDQYLCSDFLLCDTTHTCNVPDYGACQ